MSKLRTPFLAVLVALSLTACGGDDDPLGVNSGDALTEAELQLVFYAISDAFNSVEFGASGPAPAVVSVNENFSGTAECPQGGSISANGSASGTVDDESFELDLDYSLRMTPNNCAVPTETETITLQGAPYLQIDMDYLLTDAIFEISGTYEGGIAFTSTDGRSGSCAFDVMYSVSLADQSTTSSTSGTVCGVSVSALQVFEVDAQ